MTAYQKKSPIGIKGQLKGEMFTSYKKEHFHFVFTVNYFNLTIYIAFIISVVLFEFEFFL